MKDKIIFSLLVMIVLGILFFCFINMIGASICDDITQQSNVPCEIRTPKINCSDNSNITNTINDSINESVPIFLIDPFCISDCIYNFSFDYTDIGNYKIDICNGQFALINIVEKATQTTVSNPSMFAGLTFDKTQINTEVKQGLVDLFKYYLGFVKRIIYKFWWILIVLLIVILLAIKRSKKAKTKDGNV